MNNCVDIKKNCLAFLLMVSGMFMFSHAASALPDDANQEIQIEGGTSELDLANGLYIIRENAESLAHIKQGSMEIFGSEIRLEIVARVLNKATAIGTPARFQQQPDVDEPMVYISGHTLDYDNSTRLLNIDGEATYTQGDIAVNGLHIDYHLDTREAKTTARPGETVKMIITPASTDQP
jgi:lipopolysaccharide export system protein LptA